MKKCRNRQTGEICFADSKIFYLDQPNYFDENAIEIIRVLRRKRLFLLFSEFQLLRTYRKEDFDRDYIYFD